MYMCMCVYECCVNTHAHTPSHTRASEYASEDVCMCARVPIFTFILYNYVHLTKICVYVHGFDETSL